jgi:hypothetical protein
LLLKIFLLFSNSMFSKPGMTSKDPFNASLGHARGPQIRIFFKKIFSVKS